MKLLNYKLPFFAVFILAAIAGGCKKEYENIEEEDERNIQAYIQQNGLQVQQYDTTGIYYQVIKEGTGEPLDYTQQLPVIYTARSLDGSYSVQDTFVNRYGNYWGYFTPANLRETVMANLVNQGGTIRVIIPSRKAYGRSGNSSMGIKGNACLDYTVTVLEKSKLADYEDFVINAYMSANSLTDYTKSDEGIYYKVSEDGSGSEITTDSLVTATYTGKFLNGTVFDSREGVTFSIRPGDVIAAWTKMIPLIKEGGSIRFITPSSSGYGIGGTTGIPAFSPLDFEVKVTDVSQ